jgi:hypothetical protein
MKKVLSYIVVALAICMIVAPSYSATKVYSILDWVADTITFDLNSGATCVEGMIKWNDDDKTIDICTENSDVTIQSGQEMHVRGTNKTGSTLTNGQVVFINGAQGQRPTFALANATAENTSEKTIGIVTADIEHNATGYVTTTGLVRGIDTSGMTIGSVVWLANTPGGFTDIMPDTPNHAVSLGINVNKSADNGIIYVTVQNGQEISELHDVLINSVQVDDSLLWNGTYWENVPHTYGELYYHSDVATLDFSTNTALINVTGLANGVSNNMTLSDTDGSMTIIDDDTYLISLSASFRAASAGDFDLHIGIDGVDQDKCHANRRIGTGTDVGNIGITCMLELEVAEAVTFMVNSVASETIKFEALNWNMERIP